MAAQQQRMQRERQTIAAMVRLYCRDRHGPKDELCDDCTTLLDYALRRLDNCPFQENKPTCNRCTVHCYSPRRRERVGEVMRYAGPRMMLRHPLLSLGHLRDKLRKAPELPKRR